MFITVRSIFHWAYQQGRGAVSEADTIFKPEMPRFTQLFCLTIYYYKENDLVRAYTACKPCKQEKHKLDEEIESPCGSQTNRLFQREINMYLDSHM